MKIRCHWRCHLPGSHGSEVAEVPDETPAEDLAALARASLEATLQPAFWYEREET